MKYALSVLSEIWTDVAKKNQLCIPKLFCFSVIDPVARRGSACLFRFYNDKLFAQAVITNCTSVKPCVITYMKSIPNYRAKNCFVERATDSQERI